MTLKSIPAILLAPAAAAALVVLPACKPAESPAGSSASPTPADTIPASPTPAATADASPSPAGAAAAAVELKDPVARVNGEDVSKAQLEEAFNAAIQASGVNPADLTAEQKLSGYRQILDELIMDKLVAKASAGIEVSDAEVSAEIDKLKKQFPSEEAFNEQLAQAGQTPEKLQTAIRTMLQQQRWMQSQIKDKDAVADGDAQKFYDSNKEEFENPETVKASHILFMVDEDATPETVKEKEDAAKAALARAKKGEDFSALAKELSEEPGAKETGGDLGFFSKDRMVPEFADAAFSQKTGEVGGPIRTQFGWHVIKVEDKKPAGTTPFDEVKDQINAFLKSSKQREAVQAVLKSLKDSAQIESTLPPGN
ncbi:MAG: peptidylprolyl isomerase [Terrimicrobiaceae bacterium]|nr:peptidylprolyl isomerase [Terrimicrobiaceae bacterium]